MAENVVVGLKYLVKERFDYFKCPELALAKLEAYCQEEEKIEEYLTNFQSLKSEAKIPDEFTKRILLKNTREDLIERSIMQSGELQYEVFLKDL